ncbi:MAG TPA: N-acetylmuramoyl-L-alanine amidase [Candidatus Sulfotelmatobacter sp.]|nr:N-acetylmuramoyl-L-alanine amidase [Candidatus Sulfotelmatobacter sp.]
MATTISKPDVEVADSPAGGSLPAWPHAPTNEPGDTNVSKPSQRDALQALLAFSALHDQVRRRKALASRQSGFDSPVPASEFETTELFVLDEVLQLVAERAVAITGADGLAIALAENNEIVLRVAAGSVRPDPGTRIDRDSAFSGACFRTAQVINCDDTETDSRVNVEACRKMGARSMVAVPLCGRRRVIGLLEAFSSWPFAFNEIDVRNLTLLAELVLGALKPEDEDRFAESAQAAATRLETPKPEPPRAEAKPAAVAVVPPAPVVVKPTPATAAPVQPAVAAQAPPATPGKISVTPAPPAAAPYAASIKTVASPPSPKPVVPQIAEAPTSAPIPPKSFEAPAAAAAASLPAKVESAAEPALSFGQLESEKSERPWMVFMLVGIIIAAAFSVGVWWKLKNAQIGGEMVQNQAATQPSQTNPVQAPAEAATDSGAESAAIPDSNQPENTPATPQELLKFPRVTGVRHWSSGDSSTVVLDLEDQVQYEPGHLSNPERFYFDLRDTQLATELQGKLYEGDALLSHIRVAQPVSGMTRVVLEAKNSTSLSAPQVSLERDPYRLVIQVNKIGASPKTAVNLFPKAPEAEKDQMAIVVPPPTKEDLQWRAKVAKMRVVVDAGHGGWDLGTVGRRGLLEKDLVLEISERLGKLLESRLGAEVIYTRPDDNYIPLDQRAIVANTAQADLFISVHANYSDTPSARGVETYYTNLFSAPGTQDLSNPAGPKEAAMRSAAPKNLPILTLTPAELRDRIEQSRRLASSVQRSLYGTLSVQNPGLRDRGIKEAGFVVLTESAMPGILAEVSFVSSPADEQKLRSDGYREQIAEALYRGIARYAVSSKGVKMASVTK